MWYVEVSGLTRQVKNRLKLRRDANVETLSTRDCFFLLRFPRLECIHHTESRAIQLEKLHAAGQVRLKTSFMTEDRSGEELSPWSICLQWYRKADIDNFRDRDKWVL